jgi:uncharacterized protein (DUF1015 family)
MAVVKPFRGIRYNPERFDTMQVVVSQPYDRISDEFQEKYYNLSPYNIVRIIQGKIEAGDKAEGPNVYTRAKAFYQQWVKEGVLKRDEHPSYYAYEQTFTVDGKQYTRLGLIAAVQLTDFSEGVILPHEKTHSGPKEDRLRLLTTMEANSEQIFMLYPDPENKVNALIHQSIDSAKPDLDIVEIFENGVRQRVWRITDPQILAAIQQEMEPKRNLIIADGHHRYETGLNYRNAQRQKYPNAPANAAFNFVATTLVSMDDPGLVILPTHREICNFTAVTPAQILDRAKANFTVEASPDLQTMLKTINAHPTGHAFGFYDGKAFYVLTLKDEKLAQTLIKDDHAPEWKNLAVSILHKVLLEQVAEVPLQGIEDKSQIRYHRDAQEAVDNVKNGLGNFVFFVSPTRMEHIKACAAHGEKMPQKSTDFYPKVISGLTLLPLNPEEQI